jgi:hypothetical protein
VVAILLLFAAPIRVVRAHEDSLIATAICDNTKSRETAIKLFEDSDRYFVKFKKVKPLRDNISAGKMYEDGPDVEFHDVTYETFEANFILEPNGDRNLIGLSTKSTRFMLPWGLKLGQSKEQVRKILGPPTAISSKTLLYEIGGEAISDVFFNFERDKLAEVSWNYGWAD